MPPIPSQPKLGETSAKQVPCSPEWREFRQLVPWDPTIPFHEDKPSYPIQPSKNLLDILLNPLERDWLALGPAEALRGIAQSLNANLVACLPDKLIDIARLATAGNQINTEHFISLCTLNGLELLYQDGWLLVRPTYPLAEERIRIPRQALQTFMRTAWRQRQIDLRTYCLLSYQSGTSAWENPLDDFGIQALQACGVQTLQLPLPPRWLCLLLGSLSDTQWQMLHDGMEIPLRTLTPEQKTLVQAWAGSHAQPCERDTTVAGVLIPDLLLTGTEAIPWGLPWDASLRAIKTLKPVIANPIPADPGAPDAFLNEPVHPERLARWASGLIPPDNLEQLLNRRYLLGEQEWFTYQINLRPGILLQAHYPGKTSFPKNAIPLSYKDLPASFREEVEELLRKYRRG